jgi:hypothetical protein
MAQHVIHAMSLELYTQPRPVRARLSDACTCGCCWDKTSAVDTHTDKHTHRETTGTDLGRGQGGERQLVGQHQVAVVRARCSPRAGLEEATNGRLVLAAVPCAVISS